MSDGKHQKKREETNSSCSQVSTKFVTGGEGTDDLQPDFTSKLPSEILQHIISFLPLQSAAQTLLLSSHWRRAWNVVSDKTGLIEDVVPLTASFLSSVNWVLNPFTHPWKLRFQTEDGRMEMIATAGVNNKLRLEFSGGDNTKYYDLKLSIGDEHSFQHPRSDYFQVKSLCLVGVDHLSGEIVSSLIRDHLHSLERLEIRECHSLTGLIISTNFCALEHFSIIDCDHLESVRTDLHCTLNSFRYRAQSFPRYLCVRHIGVIMPEEDVMFDFRGGTADNKYVRFYKYAQFFYLCKAKHVTISQWTFQVMVKPYLHNYIFQFKYLKELWWTRADCMRGDQIDDLISFLLLCPSIVKLFITADQSPPNDSLPAMTRVTDQNCSKRRRKTKTKLRKLKLVKMEGFPDEDMMLLAHKILNIATNDPVIIFMATSPHLRPRRLVKIQPERWRFVEEIDIQLINTKHRHMSV